MSKSKKLPGLDKLPKRIRIEIEKLEADKAPGISIVPDEFNYRYFHVEIAGPDGSPYEGGVFKLEIFLDSSYPMKPPKCRFVTRIYHPNVDKVGRICLDVLKDRWTPALTVSRVCLSIQILMQEPNPDDPLDNQVAEQWKTNIKEAHAKAREITKQHAKH